MHSLGDAIEIRFIDTQDTDVEAERYLSSALNIRILNIQKAKPFSHFLTIEVIGWRFPLIFLRKALAEPKLRKRSRRTGK